ncbi:putative ATPase [Bacillus sp. TS-2]|nr:putative ATPase [Bacillus sp. TS-2]
MELYLSRSDRDFIMSDLTDEQRNFLVEERKLNKKSRFANEMAKAKGHYVSSDTTPEELDEIIKTWTLIDYLDAGPDYNKTKALRCECGRPIRYQYIVQNKITGETLKFADTHFKEHTLIPSHIVKEVKSGWNLIDLELDEVLLKFKKKEYFNQQIIPEGFEIPNKIKQYFIHSLPLPNSLEWKLNRLLDEARWMDARRKSLEASNMSKGNENSSKDHQMTFKQQSLFELEDKNKYGLDFHLSIEELDYIEQCIRKGINSVSIICENMIENKIIKNERFATNKPKIHPYICMFIESLEQAGQIKIIKKETSDYKFILN